MMELRVEHLRKSYGGVPVLRDVSFTAGEGVTCVMGPSGEGKTTLLRLLLGLERPDGGTISGLEGRPLAAVFQEDRLLMNRTALENLRFVLGPAFRETECRALLAELGLPEADGRPVSEYSGAAGWLWPGRWRCRRTCWCWTSLSPGWTGRPGTGARRPSADGAPGRWCCWPPMTGPTRRTSARRWCG